MRRWGMRAGIPVLFVALAWLALGAVGGPEPEWVEVVRDDLVLDVEIEGTLQAVETTVVGPPQIRDVWQFKVAYLAPEGEPIRAGEKVLAFDVSELRQRLQPEMAERDAARKEVEKAEKEFAIRLRTDELALAEARAELRRARLKAGRPDDLVADRELRQFRLDLELAEKRLVYREASFEASRRSDEASLGALRALAEQAAERVAATEAAIAQMERAAPIDGTVIYVQNWRGEKKQVGDTCWRGEEVIELPDLERMKAVGRVHESEAGRVREGQAVALRLDAHPDVEFAGRVAKIWKTVQTESWNTPLKIVRMEVELDETDPRRMKPGMRFRGRVETDRVPEAVMVDARAVHVHEDGPVVYRRAWRGAERVPVTLGRRNRTRVEVLDGVDPGDRVSLAAPAEGDAG